MNDNIKETIKHRDDEDYPTEFKYETTGALCISAFWIDGYGSAWFESNDGNRVVIPIEIRNLIAKRIKDGKFK